MERLFLIILILCFETSYVFANSCCGQSTSSYSVLSMGQRLSVSTGVSLVNSVGRIFASDQFYEWENKKREVRSVALNLSGVVFEKHQVFLSTNYQEGTYKDEFGSGSTNHFSDTLLGYSYELLSEYEFSYWKPVINISALINLPTGHSIYDENRLSEGADVTGHRQWGLGVGVTVKKVYHPLAITLQGKVLRLFSREFNTTKVSHFYDSTFSLMLDYSTNLWGIIMSTGINYNHLSAKKIEPANIFSDESQNFAFVLGMQKSLENNWTLGLNYSDQTLIGPAKNSILNRTTTFNVNYNYF